MRAIVIGGAGFIGKNLVKTLTTQNFEVVCCDIVDTFDVENVRYYQVKDQAEYNDIIKENDIVIYLKWNGVPVSDPDSEGITFKDNIIDLLTVLDICSKNKASKFIFSSSGGSVYGKPEYLPIDEKHRLMPISSYSIQKTSAEFYIKMVCERVGLDYHILRISNPYGPGQRPFTGQGIISTYLACSLQNRTFQFRGDGCDIRDYIYIDDLVSAIIKSIGYNGNERIFNIGSGIGYTLTKLTSDIDRILIANSWKAVNKEYIPAHPSDVNANVLDCTLAKKELNWDCKFTLSDGIKEMLLSWNCVTGMFEVF